MLTAWMDKLFQGNFLIQRAFTEEVNLERGEEMLIFGLTYMCPEEVIDLFIALYSIPF